MAAQSETTSCVPADVIYRQEYSSRDIYSFSLLCAALVIGLFGFAILMLGAPILPIIVWSVVFLGLSVYLILYIMRGEKYWVIVDQKSLCWGNSKVDDCLYLEGVKTIRSHQGIRIEISATERKDAVLGYPYTRHGKPLIEAMVQANPGIKVVRYRNGGDAF